MRTVAGSAGYVVQLTSQAVQGPSFGMQLSLPPSDISRSSHVMFQHLSASVILPA